MTEMSPPDDSDATASPETNHRHLPAEQANERDLDAAGKEKILLENQANTASPTAGDDSENVLENNGVDVPVIVGIGASAGGLSALNEFFDNLPIDTGLAYVVVQHLAAESPTLLPELLGRKTEMAVSKISAGVTIRPNEVYVIMPGTQLGIENGKLQVFEAEGPVHFSIDHFFNALASDQGTRSVGVILSGTGSDGTLGLKAINAAGGITFAQTEDSATFNAMPHNAAASGCVDYILSPGEIARKLAVLTRDIHSGREPVVAMQMAEENMNKIFFLLRQHTGHDFSRYKHSTLQRRIRRRMGIHHLRTLDAYVAFLQENRIEIEKLFDDILINVTSFFRDPELFETLRKDVFPILLKNNDSKAPIRIWVPGCSTGEEAYSLAITLMEFFGDRWADRPVQIFATDIDAKALAKARAGIYSEASLATMSISRRSDFFNKVSGGFQVVKTIRDWCVFAEQDVLKDPPFSRLDLVCCRNLFIYMDNSLQKRVLSIFHFSLRANGMLVLGSSETASQGADLFLVVDTKRKIYGRKTTHFKPRYEFEGVTSAITQHSPRLAGTGTASRNVQKEAEHYILHHYGPPAIIIDTHFDIVGFLGNTGPFVEPSPGSVSLKLLKMVHRDLVMEIRALIHVAVRDNVVATRDDVPCRINQENRLVNLKVIPLQGDISDRYFMVLFEYVSNSSDVPLFAIPAAEPGASPDNQERIRELERQLGSIREEMQGVIGEQLSTNEELQTANEEIQSANEELQSTNEELESAKEELQSTNEELATVNDELESRNDELAQLNNDLSNLLNSINLPMLMLNCDLRIRQFTSGAKPLLNVIDSDIGRPFTNLRPNLEIPGLEKIVLDVIENVVPHTLEVKDINGFLYSVNIRPYMTADHRIAGAVLVFINISDIRSDSLQSRWLSALSGGAGNALTLIDTKGDFLAWNSDAEALYGFTEAEALRMNIMNFVPAQSKNDIEDMMQRVLAKESVNAFDSVRVAKDGRRVDVLMAATGMYDQHGKINSIAISERDFTQLRIDFEKALKLSSIFDESDAMVIGLDLEGNLEYWSHRVPEHYGYSDQELSRLNFKQLMPADSAGHFSEWIQDIISGKTVSTDKVHRLTKHGDKLCVGSQAFLSMRDAKPHRIMLFERIQSNL